MAQDTASSLDDSPQRSTPVPFKQWSARLCIVQMCLTAARRGPDFSYCNFLWLGVARVHQWLRFEPCSARTWCCRYGSNLSSCSCACCCCRHRIVTDAPGFVYQGWSIQKLCTLPSSSSRTRPETGRIWESEAHTGTSQHTSIATSGKCIQLWHCTFIQAAPK